MAQQCIPWAPNPTGYVDDFALAERLNSIQYELFDVIALLNAIQAMIEQYAEDSGEVSDRAEDQLTRLAAMAADQVLVLAGRLLDLHRVPVDNKALGAGAPQ